MRAWLYLIAAGIAGAVITTPALVVLALTQLVVVLDGTIVNIALPQAQQELGLSDVERQWVVTAYALAFGALLLLGGYALAVTVAVIVACERGL